MCNSNRIVPRGIVRLAFAALTVTLAATVAVAKTAEQCQQDYDSASSRCIASSDTSHMDTPTDVRYCQQRATNKYNNCMSNATMSVPSGLKFKSTRPPKNPNGNGLFSQGLLDNTAVLTAGGPSPTGLPLTAPAATGGSPIK